MRNEEPVIKQSEIEHWITEEATGKFHYTKVLDGVLTPDLYPQLRSVMHRIKEKGLVYPVDGSDGWWRPADLDLEEVCWWDSNGVIGDNLVLPLGLNKYCYIPKPSLIIVAGRYNAGKTAFCLNLVNDNLKLWEGKIDFYVSEGAEMMKDKLERLNPYIETPPPFKMYRKTQHFADVIKPNRLSVIDYLRVDMQHPYEIGNNLFDILNKLGNEGIAAVAMQKPPGERKVAFGGASTAFEPALYIGMETLTKDSGWVGFEKIKVPKIVEIDPYFLKIHYKIERGVKFYDVKEMME